MPNGAAHEDRRHDHPGDRGQPGHRAGPGHRGAGPGGSPGVRREPRALLAGRGVRVHAVLTGPTDTDMTRGYDIPKVSAASVARAILDGVEHEEEDIFPDPLSASVADSWR